MGKPETLAVVNRKLTSITSAEFRRQGKSAKPSKYRNMRTVVDGISFMSKREATRYGELKLRERAGKILQLTLQPRFPLFVDGIKVTTYVGDFSYLLPNGRLIVEDSKGCVTPVYRIKRALMKACLGIEIVEV